MPGVTDDLQMARVGNKDEDPGADITLIPGRKKTEYNLKL
jgi:hypothetical protein